MAPTTSCVTLSCKVENIVQRAVKSIRPQMGTRRGVDELSGDPHATTRLADAAFEHIAHAKLASNLLDVDGLALVGEARIAGDNEKRVEPRKRGDDVLDHAVGEIFLLRVAAHVLERQHGDGGLVGERERRTWPQADLIASAQRFGHRAEPATRALARQCS